MGSSMVATEDSLTLSYRTAGTVTLTGADLSIEDVVRIARRGARVEVSREALERVRRGSGRRGQGSGARRPGVRHEHGCRLALAVPHPLRGSGAVLRTPGHPPHHAPGC